MHMKNKNFELFTAVKWIGEHRDISASKRTIQNSVGLHWHDFFEIEFIVAGKGTHVINGKSYPVERGCVYMLSPTDLHEFNCDEGVEIYNIMFHERMLSDDLLQKITTEPNNLVFNLNETEFSEMITLYDSIESENSKDEKYKSVFLKNMLECVLILFLRKANLSENLDYEKRNNHIQKAVMYMQLHFKENPSLKKTADAVNLNPNYFSQKFKELTGKSYIAYLTDLKLSYAKKLLGSSVLSVTEVCFLSGFSSLSNFMKIFRQKYNMSPGQYSKNRID